MFVSKKYAVATKAIILAGIELTAEPSPDLISVLWPSRLWHLQHEKKSNHFSILSEGHEYSSSERASTEKKNRICKVK